MINQLKIFIALVIRILYKDLSIQVFKYFLILEKNELFFFENRKKRKKGFNQIFDFKDHKIQNIVGDGKNLFILTGKKIYINFRSWFIWIW